MMKLKNKQQIIICIFILLLISGINLWFSGIGSHIELIFPPNYQYKFNDIKQIANWYVPSDSQRGTIQWNSCNNATIFIKGFHTVSEKDIEKKITTEHPTVSQILYSMSYLATSLKEIIDSHNIPYEKKRVMTENIIRVTDEILYALKTPIKDPMKMNDHARSVRAEYLAILIAYLESNDGLCSQNKISEYKEQLTEEINYLLEARRFTWKSNHGLMQIRSLLIIARMLDKCEVKDKLVNKAEQFIQATMHYYVAEDGAVLEASSGYWFYITRQMEIIYDYLPNKNNATATELNKLIKKTKDFLLNYSIPGGYYQGLGDCISGLNSIKTMNENSINSIKPANKFFAYSNQLVGIETPKQNSVQQLLFVSLDTPPAIHKLPEDLAIYFLISKPYFINTGTYGYDSSPERNFILSEYSQSTVIPAKKKSWKSCNPTKSQLNSCIAKLDENTYILQGCKAYGEKHILRTIEYSPQKGFLRITDTSNDIKELCSQFNISPDVSIKFANKALEKCFILDNGIEAISFNIIKGHCLKNKTWVSPSWLKKQEITQLQIYGDSVVIEILFKPIYNAPMVQLSGSIKPFTERLLRSKLLAHKYIFSLKRVLVGRICICLMFASFLFIIMLTKLSKYRSILIIYAVTVSLVYLVDFITSGQLLTFNFI